MLPAAPELFGLSPAAPALDAIRAERRSGGPERVVPALDATACKALAGIGCCAAACVPGGLRGFASLQRASDMLSRHSMRASPAAIPGKFRCALTKTTAADIEYTEKRTEAFPCPVRESSSVRAEMLGVRRELEQAYNEFDNITDPLLMEACIYEINALRAKYNCAVHDLKNLTQ